MKKTISGILLFQMIFTSVGFAQTKSHPHRVDPTVEFICSGLAVNKDSNSKVPWWVAGAIGIGGDALIVGNHYVINRKVLLKRHNDLKAMNKYSPEEVGQSYIKQQEEYYRELARDAHNDELPIAGKDGWSILTDVNNYEDKISKKKYLTFNTMKKVKQTFTYENQYPDAEGSARDEIADLIKKDKENRIQKPIDEIVLKKPATIKMSDYFEQIADGYKKNSQELKKLSIGKPYGEHFYLGETYSRVVDGELRNKTSLMELEANMKSGLLYGKNAKQLSARAMVTGGLIGVAFFQLMAVALQNYIDAEAANDKLSSFLPNINPQYSEELKEWSLHKDKCLSELPTKHLLLSIISKKIGLSDTKGKVKAESVNDDGRKVVEKDTSVGKTIKMNKSKKE
jgi:hypothetical protein